MSTTTIAKTLSLALDNSLPGELASALERFKLGQRETLIKRTFTGLTGAASYDLTALDATTESPAAVAGVNNANRLPAKIIKTLRVTAATTANTVGSYAITDAAGTMLSPTASTVVGLARISDDGKSVSFPTADVTAFIIEYYPGGRTDGGVGTPWPESAGNLW